ncbi:MAG: TetR/AcrR family transcriptional regulator [Rubrobacteraceae bacterium]
MDHPPESAANRPVTSRGRKTRQKVLGAAEEIFGEKGYDRASIVEITRRAGVAQGTFYVYFPDKKSVFTELVRGLSRQLRRDIAAAVEGIPDRIEVERVGFHAFFDFTHQHQNFYKIIRQAEFVDEELFRWYYRKLAEGYTEGLSKAMRRGEIRELHVECLAYCLMGISDFLGMRWVLWNDEPPPDKVFESMFAFIRHGMDNRPAEIDGKGDGTG